MSLEHSLVSLGTIPSLDRVSVRGTERSWERMNMEFSEGIERKIDRNKAMRIECEGKGGIERE